uniref:Uncharacterized protein n=1 Tax=Triticum urartu TaxID=4572 RepID=A0A8R7K473_TRIUA
MGAASLPFLPFRSPHHSSHPRLFSSPSHRCYPHSIGSTLLQDFM